MISEQEVISLVAEAFNTDPAALTAASHRDEVEEWDSMGVLMLMAELDERFGIVLDEDALVELETIGDIVKLLDKQGQVSA